MTKGVRLLTIVFGGSALVLAAALVARAQGTGRYISVMPLPPPLGGAFTASLVGQPWGSILWGHFITWPGANATQPPGSTEWLIDSQNTNGANVPTPVPGYYTVQCDWTPPVWMTGATGGSLTTSVGVGPPQSIKAIGANPATTPTGTGVLTQVNVYSAPGQLISGSLAGYAQENFRNFTSYDPTNLPGFPPGWVPPNGPGAQFYMAGPTINDYHAFATGGQPNWGALANGAIICQFDQDLRILFHAAMFPALPVPPPPGSPPGTPPTFEIVRGLACPVGTIHFVLRKVNASTFSITRTVS